MNTRFYTMVGSMLALAALSGCVSRTPSYDASFGTALRATTAAQLANPAAASNPSRDPVAGLDGRAAAAAQTTYEHSYAHPDTPQSMVGGAGK
jgi:hypothetical protein